MSVATLALKEKLDSKQLLTLSTEFDKVKKSKTTAYLLWFFLGVLGGHRFYARNTLMGILMALTLGGCGIWALLDVFFIGSRIEALNDEIETDLIRQVSQMTMPETDRQA